LGDQISVELEEIQRLTAEHSAGKNMDTLVPLIKARMAELTESRVLRGKGSQAVAGEGLDNGHGRRLMDTIRAEMGRFTQLQEAALEQHDRSFKVQMHRMFSIIVFASLLSLVLGAAFAFWIYREAKFRMGDLAHLETERLLLLQEESNRRLQHAYFTLQLSEEKLAVTLASIGDAVIATDDQGRVTLMNRRAEQLTGWMQAEAADLPVDRVFHIINQETRQAATIPVLATLSRGTIHEATGRALVARDGSECAIADSCAPIRDHASTVIGAVLVFRDVTEACATQQALLDRTALIQTVLNTVEDGIITLRASDATVETVNPAAERMFGYTAEELVGQNVSLLIPELDRNQNRGFLEYYSSSDNARAAGLGHEVVGCRKNGTKIPLEIALSEMGLGGQRYFTGIFRDITARKQAEEVLLKGGALQNAIFNSANFSSIATDAEGVIQIFNVGAERMLGYSAEDVINKITPADISDPQEVIVRAKALSDELGTTITPGFEALVFKASRGIEDIYELTYIRKDGSRLPAAVSVTALRDAQSSIIGYLLIGTDISARKRAEEALLKAGALQSAIFNSANFSSIATDAKGVIQIFNVGAERMLGYEAEDVMNKITPADISDPQEVITRAKALSLELGTTITPGFEALVFKASRGIEDIYELTYIRKDGSRFPAVVSVTALRDDQDAIIGYLLIGTDNSARKRAEQALLKAGALQNAIFNSANFSSIATDAKGVIQIFNVGAERMLGYQAADVVNKITPADISDPLEVIARAKSLSQELETTITPGFEALVFKASRGIEDIYQLTYIRKDGSRFPAMVSVTALRDDQDAVIGYLLIGTDNTARKRVEAEQERLGQRLRDSQFYARSLFEFNVDALMTTDPSGFITDTNKQMEVLTGCTRDELIGAQFKSYFTEPDRADESIKLVLAEKKITNYELTVRARNGKETVVSFNATTFFDRDRNLQGVFAAARDVTEAKRLDLVLQENNIELESAKSAAEKANLAKSEFLSSMSHELRSPLNAILGFAQLMESDTLPPTLPQQESLSQILQAGWHLLRLIDQILDLAKVESGQIPMSQEPVSMAEVLLECQSMVEHQAQQRDIRMSYPVFDEHCFVLGDHTRVKQVVINLLSNAIKYNTSQGSVVMAYEEIRAGRIRVSIKDTGKGLTPEQMGQLFQAFNRLGQEGAGEEGTGIGLVVAKRLIELMGGTIGVESTIGAGSVFWFELNTVAEPLFVGEGSAELALAQGPMVRRSRLHTLLYIEDNPANLKLVEQILTRQPDLHLLTAENGARGIELAHEAKPDLILMDINLPDISGFDALKILRSDPATAHILVMALSANAMPLDIEKALRNGFFRYVTKPIKIKEFLTALDDALEMVDQENQSGPVVSPSP
jgi:PAS domain S-box-containing protein